MIGASPSSPWERGRPAHFLWMPPPSEPTAAGLCRHNLETAKAMGRNDLAEIWRLLVTICSEDSHAREGLQARPFAKALVRQIVHQLFSVQETLTLAMVGVVLLCWASKTRRRDDDEMPATRTCTSAALVGPLRHRRTGSRQLQGYDSSISARRAAFTWGSSQDFGIWAAKSRLLGKAPSD